MDRITYAQLDAHTRRLAAGFIDAGVGKGKRVGLIMPNGVAWAEIAGALTRIGAVLVPLSTLPQASELVAHLRVASVQALIAVEEFRGHRHLDDLRSESAALPALRQVSTAERVTRMRGGRTRRPDARRTGGIGSARRHPDHHVHHGKQRFA